jgi:hypothetical protein
MKLYGLSVVIITCIVLVLAVALQPIPKLPQEGFVAPQCPTSAKRNEQGKIVVEPGNMEFSTMKEYVAYLSNIYTKDESAGCVPPVVQGWRNDGSTPVPGILGGQGNGAVPASSVGKEGPDRSVMMTNPTLGEQTSADSPINKLDDYEYSRIYELERAPRISPLQKETVNKLTSQHVLDWASLPFSSEKAAEEQKEFIAGRMEGGFRDPKSGAFFKNMEGAGVMPPDQEALEAREKAILAAYKPTDISKHTVDSETEQVGKLVSKLYENDPAWEPVIEKTGENQWAVTELRPKPRKETWEDDTPSVALAESQGLASANPVASIQIYDRQMNDPAFDKRGVSDYDNNKFWDYANFNKWTPGLERMFAPTADTKDWY